ncbi:MAG: hypothetical protein LRY63_04110 [Nitrincola sp.]|nr:hypothetical protein [Nitrincola sp.]
MTLLQEILPDRLKKALILFSDVMVLLFSGLLLYVCLLWFDPFELMKANFEFGAFQMETFNFIYSETTNTLGLKKILDLAYHALDRTVFNLALND